MGKFSIVKKYIDKMDYYNLLSEGAPQDEFDNESLEISKKIMPDSNTVEVAKVIAEVFNRTFSNNDSYDSFVKYAHMICEEMNLNKEK